MNNPFDPILCASLHNQIVEHTHSKHPFPITRNFFVAYGDEAEQVRERLTPQMIQFLENIYLPTSRVDNDDEGSSTNFMWNFTPHLSFPHPNFWVLVGCDGEGENAHYNWIVLYPGTEACHGLYYDLDMDMCTWLEELSTWPAHRGWQPLERGLRLWLSFFETGRFRSSQGDASIDPTVFIRCLPVDLEITVRAYNDLVTAIHDRMARDNIPASAESRTHLTSSVQPTTPFSSQTLLFSSTILRHGITGFYAKFMTRAQRPSCFTSIAPGLGFPSDQWLSDSLNADKDSPRWQLVRHENLVPHADVEEQDTLGEPLPLFLGPPLVEESENFAGATGIYVIQRTTGLYLYPTHNFADAVSLYLPWPVGGYGWLDDAENPRPSDAYWPDTRGTWEQKRAENDKVFLRHRNPLLRGGEVRLFEIFREWKKLVVDGVWSVGPNGVEGGIEKWKEADSREFVRTYQLPVCYDAEREVHV